MNKPDNVTKEMKELMELAERISKGENVDVKEIITVELTGIHALMYRALMIYNTDTFSMLPLIKLMCITGLELGYAFINELITKEINPNKDLIEEYLKNYKGTLQ